MNILTKICVVLLVVASLVASVVFISLATVHPNYRTWYEKEHLAYMQLDAACRSYIEDADRSKIALAKAQEVAGKDKIKLQAELDNALAEVRTLKLQLLNKDQRHAEMNASLETLTKSDQAPAQWLPPNRGFHCQYVTQFVMVMAGYRLTVDRPSRDVMAAVLRSCAAVE